MSDQAVLVPGQQVPFSQEAEEATIGAVLVDPGALLTVASFLREEDFYFLRNAFIWRALLNLNLRNDAIDYVTLTNELYAIGKLEEVGGQAYLTYLAFNVPTSQHAEVYGRIVQRASLRRRLMKAADEIRQLATSEDKPIEAVTSEAEAALFNVTESQTRREITPMQQAISDYYDRIDRLMRSQQDALGLPTGYVPLDRLLGGLQRSDLLIFAGRPGMGKTSFLLSLALNSARFGGRVLIFTMEMGVEQITQRFLSMETGINMQKLRLGQLEPNEYSRFLEAMARLSQLPIFIDDTPALNPIQMRTKCRRVAHEYGIDLVIVDYLQLMNAGKSYENNRVQEISYISRALKELARELNVPVLSAAQLSRAVEQRQDKRPVLSDLRESGSIEQDSDIVMFLYRDVVYNEATEFPNQANIIVAKHRNGPTGVIDLYFDKTVTRFVDADSRTIDLREL